MPSARPQPAPALPTRVLAVIVSLLAVTACRDGASPLRGRLTRADTVYVGVAVGLESPERYVNVFRGVQVALDELNAARPAGAPALALRRPRAGAKSAVEIAAAFRDDPAVVGVVGHTESAATISAAPEYGDRAGGGRHALVAVSPTANAALVTRVNGWIFRVCPVVADQARALARYAADSLKVARVAVLYRNDPSGKDFLRAFGDEYGAHAGVVVERDPFTEDIAEFDAYAERIVRRGVRAIVISGNASEARKAIRAVRRAGGRPVVLATNPPDAADSAAQRDFAGMRYVALYAADRSSTDAGTRFAAEFRQRTGAAPDHWAALGYDAAMLIGQAVQEVGPDRRRVRDWIASVGTTRPAYEGATGTIRFERGGDPREKMVLVREVAP